MVLFEGKDGMVTAEASSEPVASNNQTPKSLKAKPKIIKKAVNNNKPKDTTPLVQGKKKILKKKIMAGNQIINENKEEMPSLDGQDMKQKAAFIGEQSKTSLENSTERSVSGNKILKKKIVAGSKIINKNKEDLPSVDGEDMKQKVALTGEQSRSSLENSAEKSVSGRRISKKKIVACIKIINKKEDVPSSDGEDMKQKVGFVGEQSKTSLETSTEKSVSGSKILKKIVGGNKIINNKKQDVRSVNSGDMEKKNVPIGEQSKSNVENLKEKSVVSESNKMDNSDDKVISQSFNTEELKPKGVIGEENIKNNHANMKKKKKVIAVRKVNNSSNDKGGDGDLNKEELKQKNVSGSEKREKSPDDVKNKVERNENNRENFDGSRNKRHKQNREERNGSLRNEEEQKNIEKLSGSVGNDQRRKDEGRKHQREGEQKEKKNKKVGGVIFFCSAKTKPDCFRYNIMGVSMNKKDLVLSIKPGIKLFLYDFGVKLLYGIYRASSPGGMKLEPAAFNGSFPVQVRFEIYQDCYPLPESIFKRAIEENYDGKNKFDPELSYQQVNKLMALFKPADVKQLASPPIYPPRAVSIGRDETKERETEYLEHRHKEPLAREPYNYDERRRYDLHLNETDEHLEYRRAPSAQRKASPEQLFLSEKDYRTHGLRREGRNLSPPASHIAPTLELDPRAQGQFYRYPEKEYTINYGHLPRQELHSSGPYKNPSTTSIVDSYLKVPYYGSSSDLYQPPVRRETEEVDLGSYSLARRVAVHQPEASYLPRREIYGRRENTDVGSLYSSYASKALSEYNQQRTNEGNKPQNSLATVSARYSFAGPSRQYQ